MDGSNASANAGRYDKKRCSIRKNKYEWEVERNGGRATFTIPTRLGN